MGPIADVNVEPASLASHEERTGGPTYATSASGISGLIVTGRYWVADPKRHAAQNLSVGVGLKFPTGNDRVEDEFLVPLAPDGSRITQTHPEHLGQDRVRGNRRARERRRRPPCRLPCLSAGRTIPARIGVTRAARGNRIRPTCASRAPAAATVPGWIGSPVATTF